MKCETVSTCKGWSSWCKTHSREQIACLKEEVALLRSALEHALRYPACSDAGNAVMLEQTDPCCVMTKVSCPSCRTMILVKRGGP